MWMNVLVKQINIQVRASFPLYTCAKNNIRIYVYG